MHKKIGFYIIISFITHIAISGYSLYYIYVLDKYKLFSFSLLLVADASVCHFFLRFGALKPRQTRFRAIGVYIINLKFIE